MAKLKDKQVLWSPIYRDTKTRKSLLLPHCHSWDESLAVCMHPGNVLLRYADPLAGDKTQVLAL